MSLKSFKQFLNKPTLSIEEIAKKHNKSVDYLKHQLKQGISIEKEHTDSDKVAMEIALDHLSENPNYYRKLKKFVENVNESLEDIQGKVVDVNELSKHLNKTQMKNLMNHEWHKRYAAYPGKPTAYRVSSHRDALGGGKIFSIEAGNGVPRNKETFGDKEDVRHMVSFEFYKNKIGNAHLFRNHGDQRHRETGQKVWVYHKSHKLDD